MCVCIGVDLPTSVITKSSGLEFIAGALRSAVSMKRDS